MTTLRHLPWRRPVENYDALPCLSSPPPWRRTVAGGAAAAPPSEPLSPAAVDVAQAASHAAAAAYLHPKASAHQVKHILGAAAHAAQAEELASEQDQRVTARTLEWARHHAPIAVTTVLGRLPVAPPAGGRVGEFIRDLDAALRA
jgi:hypothetical protein